MRHDDEAVRRILAGTLRVVDAHPEDRDQAIRLMLADGLSETGIAARLGTGWKTVRRVMQEDEARAARRARVVAL